MKKYCQAVQMNMLKHDLHCQTVKVQCGNIIYYYLLFLPFFVNKFVLHRKYQLSICSQIYEVLPSELFLCIQ
jgi:hypothetical protein